MSTSSRFGESHVVLAACRESGFPTDDINVVSGFRGDYPLVGIAVRRGVDMDVFTSSEDDLLCIIRESDGLDEFVTRCKATSLVDWFTIFGRTRASQ
jgi:hypothetical protein